MNSTEIDTSKDIKDECRQYKLLVQNLSEGIWVIDKNLKVAFVNTTMSDMLGYDTNDMVGKPMLDFLSDECSEKVKKTCADYKSVDGAGHEVKKKCESNLSKSNGETIYASIQCSFFFDSENNFKGIISSILDISEKKETEEKLIKNEKTFRELIECTQTAYVVMDEKLLIQEANTILSEMMNLNTSDIIGQNPRTWVDNNDIERFDRIFAGVINGRPIEESEIKFKLPNGKSLYVIVNANIIINGGKRIMCLIRDITEKKNIEQVQYVAEQHKKDRIKQKISEIRTQLKQNMS